MSHMSRDHNLGPIDRLIRSVLGFSLINQAIKKTNPFSAWFMLGGTLLIVPGITGTDPFLKALGISTRPSDENYFINLAKQVKPGYGMKPILAEQACPTRPQKPHNLSDGQTLASALTIG